VPRVACCYGVFVSIWPPAEKANDRRLWVISFLLVGVVAFFAVYMEMSSSDSTMSVLTDQVKELQPSPRLEFGGVTSKETTNGRLYTLNFHNTADSDIIGWNLDGGLFGPETSEDEFLAS
jgi:dipeptide/tripeptide permease